MNLVRLEDVNLDRLLARAVFARGFLKSRVRYKLGEGGFDPAKPFPNGSCDCSGFAAAVLGMSRNQQDKKKPWSLRIPWIETTAIFNDAKGAQLLFVQCAEPIPGCLVVYPDRRVLGIRRQGHVGVIDVDETQAIDCATGRFNTAIRRRPVKFWLDRGGIVVCLKEDLAK